MEKRGSVYIQIKQEHSDDDVDFVELRRNASFEWQGTWMDIVAVFSEAIRSMGYSYFPDSDTLIEAIDDLIHSKKHEEEESEKQVEETDVESEEA